MKQKILSILLLVLLLVTPIMAEEQAYTITLNGISFSPSAPLILKDNNLFITLEDLSDMLFAPLTYSDSTYKFTANNQKIELNSQSYTYLSNSKQKTLPSSTFSTNNLVYVPVQLLEDLGYTFTLDTNTKVLSVSTITPYSRNADDPKDHSFIPSKNNLENVPSHVIDFSSHSQFQKAIDTAIQHKQYISFLDNSSFRDVYNTFSPKLAVSPYHNISITFRALDTSTYPAVIKDTITLPVSIKMTPDSFKVTIGEETIDYTGLWATYYPAHSLTDIDLDKTADATLMRIFYTYYRNRYDLRDDTYFSPYATITSDRTNVMSHGAYSLSHEELKTDYMINVYRVHPTGSMHYMIDIEALNLDFHYQ